MAAATKTNDDAMKNGALVIDQSKNRCHCGCGAERKGKARFLQGHDAKLRGRLARAHRNGVKEVVVISEDGTETVDTPAARLVAHAWPVPADKPAKKAAVKKDAAPAKDEKPSAPARRRRTTTKK